MRFWCVSDDLRLENLSPPQLQGLSQVGLHPDWLVLGLRGSSLISSEGSLQTWTTDFSLGWVGFGESERLSKTTKLILLDSLLQEVCIQPRTSVF